MTLVGYFNSMRELGGMRRLVDDDVRTAPAARWTGAAWPSGASLEPRPRGTDLAQGSDGHPARSSTGWKPPSTRRRKKRGKLDEKDDESADKRDAARRAAGHEHDLGRRGREAARA